jgi:endonuclease/exonuclease/phosphatase family metal-dependent hydrolase
MTLNVQFYKVISSLYGFLEDSEKGTCKAFGELILEHMPDVVCIQEDVFPRPHSLGLDRFYTEVVHCLAERVQFEDGPAHLANTIFVRKSLDLVVSDSGTLALDNGGSTERCMSFVTVNGIKIANTHLQGGRFADEDYAKLLHTKAREVIQIIQETVPDVIVGDFNSGKRAHADKTLQRHPLYKKLSPQEKSTFMDYFSGVHDVLATIGYTSAYEEKDVGTTSIFGGVPDWIYLKDDNVRVHGRSQVLSDVLTNQLSDHAAVIVHITKTPLKKG